MKPLLSRDRATSGVSACSSRTARFGAWAKESLVARGLAVAVGLGVLALIGGSALAGGTAAKAASASELSAASLAPVGALQDSHVDAAVTPTTPLERAPPELRTPVAAAADIELDEPSAPADTTPASRGAATKNVARATPDDPVDLNTARVDDLRRLPGIGAKRAEAILALRARLPGGRFRQLEDLLKVKGVGRAMIKRIHPLVRLSGGEPASR